jgi:hypothetical protein
MTVGRSGIYRASKRSACKGLPGVYSTIWCLCYKTNKLKKRKEKWRRQAGSNRLSKGVVRGQREGSPVEYRGIASPPARTRIRNVGTARTPL